MAALSGENTPHPKKNDRVLITGAAGFIGSHLAGACLGRGWDVIGVDSFADYYGPDEKHHNLATLVGSPGWDFRVADLVTDPLDELVDGVDVVFHLAAQPGVRRSWGSSFDRYVDSNVTALQRLLEAVRDRPIRRFVFASSSSVYGDAAGLPTPEEAPLLPVSPYGATKALGEDLCRIYQRGFGVPTVMLRYFTVYGPRQRPDMAFNRIISAGLNGEQITVYGDGLQTRDFTFVTDTVAATVSAGGDGGRVGAAYNIGGGTSTSLLDVLGFVQEAIGRPLNIEHAAVQRGDARHTSAKTERARTDFGFEPAVSLSDGIAQQVVWHRGRG